MCWLIPFDRGYLAAREEKGSVWILLKRTKSNDRTFLLESFLIKEQSIWESRTGGGLRDQQTKQSLMALGKNGTYVTIASFPQAFSPRMAPSWGFQTATALLVDVLHETTQPSASPVSKRELLRMNATAWI
jgi:hypothetical protein